MCANNSLELTSCSVCVFVCVLCACRRGLLVHCVNPIRDIQCLITLGVIVDIFHFNLLRRADGRGVSR